MYKIKFYIIQFISLHGQYMNFVHRNIPTCRDILSRCDAWRTIFSRCFFLGNRILNGRSNYRSIKNMKLVHKIIPTVALLLYTGFFKIQNAQLGRSIRGFIVSVNSRKGSAVVQSINGLGINHSQTTMVNSNHCYTLDIVQQQ